MHKNNFDFLRLIFSIFVVITHSSILSGIKETDILAELTHSQTTLSYIGVRGFFVISGFLIFQSIKRSSSLRNYFLKRCLRLFPGLIVVLFITVLFGFLLSDSTFQSYLLNKSMWTYLPNNLSLYNLQLGIKGVLNNQAINGSLWTLRYEFSFYILIALLFTLKNKALLTRRLLLALFILVLGSKLFLFNDFGRIGVRISDSNSVNFALYFISGSLLASFKSQGDRFKIPLLLFFLIGLTLSFYVRIFVYAQFLLLPPLIILIGNSSTKYIHSFSSKYGDISYGIYIYSFPIQKILMYFYNLDHLQLMAISLTLSIIFGILSWNLVEKKALLFKQERYKEILLKPLFRITA
jgi:peptidoglycan/LPS O-acetylase OafA/YrhL